MPDIIPADIEAYAAAHTSPLPPLLEELVRETKARFPERSGMLSGQVEGQFLQMLVATTGALRVLEIGTFTGFSALMMAAALPANGELITLELSPEHAAFARGFFDRSPDGFKILLIEGPALESLARVAERFDFVFIDANKSGYAAYYDAVLPMLADGGLIAVDNVLWSGEVLDPKSDDGRAIVAFNKKIAEDDRVVQVMTTIRDGVTLIRKVD
ncbi:MAG TPA: class I SAM-dependent methyltransferase [Dehalococcoidia bacterium]|jgi:caffeoyl-CoA O-methyltransferase|nr:class I SAM-dependent methyltransferase [Dehalococcoidia bacterium]